MDSFPNILSRTHLQKSIPDISRFFLLAKVCFLKVSYFQVTNTNFNAYFPSSFLPIAWKNLERKNLQATWTCSNFIGKGLKMLYRFKSKAKIFSIFMKHFTYNWDVWKNFNLISSINLGLLAHWLSAEKFFILMNLFLLHRTTPGLQQKNRKRQKNKKISWKSKSFLFRFVLECYLFHLFSRLLRPFKLM